MDERVSARADSIRLPRVSDSGIYSSRRVIETLVQSRARLDAPTQIAKRGLICVPRVTPSDVVVGGRNVALEGSKGGKKLKKKGKKRIYNPRER